MPATATNSQLHTEARINSLLANEDYRIDICVLFTLLWVANCDGGVSQDESRFILDKLPVDNSIVNSAALLAIIRSEDQASFESVFSVLQNMSEQEKNFVLELAVGVASLKGQLSNAKLHALSFLADLIGGGFLKLKVVYNIVAGKEMPTIGDPGSVSWWKNKDKGIEDVAEQDDGEGRSKVHSASGDLSKVDALHLLGLEKNADAEAIKKAYKRRLQHFHPDRFETKGPEAKKAAQQAFLRVRHAYEVLTKDALKK